MTELDQSQQLVTDFKVGDVVRRSDRAPRYGEGIGQKGDKFVVAAVLPTPHRDPDDMPGRVGELQLEGHGDESFGHLLFLPPLVEDNLTVEDLRAALADAEHEREVAQQQARDAMASYEQVREVLNNDRTLWQAEREQLHSEIDQANAATVLEAHRANKADATARRLQRVLTYALSIMKPAKRGMVAGYRAGLDVEQ